MTSHSRFVRLAVVSSLFVVVPGALDAHFKMLEPASWIVIPRPR